MITLQRQTFKYTFRNSCVYTVSHTLILKIEGEKSPILLLPVEKYRADLEVLDSEGNHLVVVPDKEFEKQFTTDKLADFSDIFLSDISHDGTGAEKPEIRNMLTGIRVIAVILPRANDDIYYDKITLKWTEQIENRKMIGSYTQYVEIPIKIPRYSQMGSTSALYVSIKTNQKYLFQKNPVIVDLVNDERPDFEELIDDVRHHVYRFSPSNHPQMIGIFAELALPPLINAWASYGTIAASVVPPIIFIASFVFGQVPRFGFEVIGGIIAFVIGLRVVISQDINLMEKWNEVHFKVLKFAAGILLVLVVLSGTDAGPLQIGSELISGWASDAWGVIESSSLHLSDTISSSTETAPTTNVNLFLM